MAPNDRSCDPASSTGLRAASTTSATAAMAASSASASLAARANRIGSGAGISWAARLVAISM